MHQYLNRDIRFSIILDKKTSIRNKTKYVASNFSLKFFFFRHFLSQIIMQDKIFFPQVRKAQLANLLEEEKRKYESELKALGKAFYIERL